MVHLGQGERSSAGERLLHTQDVTGSIPVVPTTQEPSKRYRAYRAYMDESPTTGHRRLYAPIPSVYFVRAQTLGLIKIGFATDVPDRLRIMQIGSPDKLELVGAYYHPEALAQERRLHAKFRADRSHGEWFRESPALLSVIADHPLSDWKRSKTESLREAMEHARKAARLT